MFTAFVPSARLLHACCAQTVCLGRYRFIVVFFSSLVGVFLSHRLRTLQSVHSYFKLPPFHTLSKFVKCLLCARPILGTSGYISVQINVPFLELTFKHLGVSCAEVCRAVLNVPQKLFATHRPVRFARCWFSHWSCGSPRDPRADGRKERELSVLQLHFNQSAPTLVYLG